MPMNETLEPLASLTLPTRERDSASTQNPEDGDAFFQAVRQGFERAAHDMGGTYDYDYQLGGEQIALRFASPLLASKITPALAHRAVSPAPPALTICLWDSASTRTGLHPSVARLIASARPYPTGILGTRGELAAYSDRRFRAAFNLGSGILSVLDTELNLAVYWIEDAAQLPYYEQGAPLKTILSWWMSEHARQFVHAGAVGTADGGLLLAGKSGSGKSTTALACLGSPLKYVSDDYALIAMQPEPYVYNLYNTAKLNGQADLDRFPQLASRVHNLERLSEEKLMIFLEPHFAHQLRTGFPIKAVLVPRVSGKSETTLQPLTPGAALTALGMSTLFQLSGSGQAALHMMALLVRRMPCYELALGRDVAQIPQVLSSVL